MPLLPLPPNGRCASAPIVVYCANAACQNSHIAAARQLTYAAARAMDEDESIAAFVRRRFGEEAVDYLAEPLLAGIHAGDVERLSIRALFPRLVEAEGRHGSIIRAFARRAGRGPGDGVYINTSGFGIVSVMKSIELLPPELSPPQPLPASDARS